MKSLSHRTGHIAATREMAAAQARREKETAPLAEHIQGHCMLKPMQRIFLSYRSPWRKYYYAKSGRMKGRIAERAISGSGWNWYMSRGSANLLFKSHEPFALAAIARERNREHKAGSAAIDNGNAKAHCTKNAETLNVAGIKNDKSEKIACDPAVRMEKTGTANMTRDAAPVSGGSEIQKTNGKNNHALSSGASVNAPGAGAGIRIESAGFPGLVENAAPSQAAAGSVQSGGVFSQCGMVVDAAIRAAASAMGTNTGSLDMANAMGAIAGLPGMVFDSMNVSMQSAMAAALAQETKTPQDTKMAGYVPAAKAGQAGAGASITTETIPTGGAFMAARIPDAGAKRIRMGPGYIGSGQKKTVQLKTTQGAADVPQ